MGGREHSLLHREDEMKVKFLKDVNVYLFPYKKIGDVHTLNDNDKIYNGLVYLCIGHGEHYLLKIGEDIEIVEEDKYEIRYVCKSCAYYGHIVMIKEDESKGRFGGYSGAPACCTCINHYRWEDRFITVEDEKKRVDEILNRRN